ncbi:MAG: aldolase/citrate lyase family protein, partial [Opitutaceae bacterium]
MNDTTPTENTDPENDANASSNTHAVSKTGPMNRRDFIAATAGLAAVASAVSVANAQPAPTAAPATAPAAAPAGRGRGGRGGPPIPAGSQTFNTVITKLKEGKQIFSNTIIQPDLEAAKKACEGQDFIWIEMQHSRLTWRESEDLVRVVAQAGCIPFIRVPSANEGDIQKATDSGALGIIVPMVDDIQEARNAVMFAKWPIGSRDNPNAKPWGHRSSGGGQAGSLWGSGYQTNANNNILIMIQIENPQGVGLIDAILDEVQGIDIVMVASNDFGWQAGDRDGDESYNAREKLVRESVLAHGKILAGPSSWQTRPG